MEEGVARGEVGAGEGWYGAVTSESKRVRRVLGHVSACLRVSRSTVSHTHSLPQSSRVEQHLPNCPSLLKVTRSFSFLADRR